MTRAGRQQADRQTGKVLDGAGTENSHLMTQPGNKEKGNGNDMSLETSKFTPQSHLL